MPKFRLVCRELVYVDRIYEVEATDGAAAVERIQRTRGGAGDLMEQTIVSTHSFVNVEYVCDENGNEVEDF